MLTVHKNTKVQRKAKELRKDIVADAKSLSQLKNITGYAIIVWNDELTADCTWKSKDSRMPTQCMPEFAKMTLTRYLIDHDTNAIIDNRFY